MSFVSRRIFISSLFIGLFVSNQVFSNPETETVEKLAQAGDHHQHPQNIPVVPGNPLEGTVSAPPTGKANNITQSPKPAPGKKLHNPQPSSAPASPASSPLAVQKKLQPQDVPPQVLEDIPTSPFPPENLNRAATPPPANQPHSIANRKPQNVAKKLEEMTEVFDYSSKVIIFYKPCENQPVPCRHPLMTNRKDIMFRYDKNRNINVSGIANYKKKEQTTSPPDSTETTQVN